MARVRAPVAVEGNGVRMLTAVILSAIVLVATLIAVSMYYDIRK